MKFDQELYNKADPLSNGVMESWLKRNGYSNVDLKETYGVDITCKKDSVPAFFETEIKYSWVRQWPNEWMEVRIPYRKHKIVDKWIRSDCKQAWFIDGLVVKNSRVAKLNTKYTTNEEFYHIDVNDAHIINMEKEDVEKDFVNGKYPS